MLCGSKCFFVEMEGNGKKDTKSIIARTPAEARKTVRKKFGKKIEIISVREGKRNTYES